MPNTHTTPLVSVLMPAYNHASYVRAAVESVLGQTYGNLELIAIDDASSDATWNVLQSFEDDRLRRYRHDSNQGAHATLNEALGLARGKFIAIINSDDVYYPARLQKAISCLMANQHLGACFTRYDFIDKTGRVVRDSDSLAADFPDIAKSLGTAAETLERNELQVMSLLARNYLHTTSNLICRREVIDQVGTFRRFRYVHDHDFFLRLSHRFPIEVIPESLLGYRFHAANTLAESAAASVAETAAMLAEFLLTHELKAMRHDSPAFLAVLGYLLENFRAYGADRLVLLLVLAEAGDCRRPDSAMPMFHDCFSDEGIMSRVGSLLHKDRAVEDLCWQRSQTTKWWEETQKRGNQLARMRVRQDRVGKKLWETRQALHEVQGTLHETQSTLEQTERQLAWWREKYRRTLTARIRRVARILSNATLKISRNRNQ
ncbi:MAG: glycosyltransferase [Thiobacillus sp.]|nr:glycosyltransferase [Thiobacillus sp.]